MTPVTSSPVLEVEPCARSNPMRAGRRAILHHVRRVKRKANKKRTAAGSKKLGTADTIAILKRGKELDSNNRIGPHV
jgi:hypothetical protein